MPGRWSAAYRNSGSAAGIRTIDLRMMPAAVLNPAESRNRCRTRILQIVFNRETMLPPLCPRTRTRLCPAEIGRARRCWSRGADGLFVSLKFAVLGQRKAQKLIHEVVLVVVRPFAHQCEVTSDRLLDRCLQLHTGNSTDAFFDLEFAHPSPLSTLRISD